MLSAHKPYENYPSLIKSIANQYGATAQMAEVFPLCVMELLKVE